MAAEPVDEETLSSLTQVARDLARVSLQCEVGLRSVEREVQLRKTEHPLIQLKRKKEWLHQQRIDTEAELMARRVHQQEDLKSSSEQAPESLSDLMERVLKLQDNLMKISSERSYRKLTLDRVLLQNVMKKHLSVPADSKSQADILSVQTMTAKIDDLSKEILKNHKVLEEDKQQLYSLKLDNTEMILKNRQLEEKLKELLEDDEDTRENESSTEKKRLKDRLKVLEAKSLVVQNVLQSLVVGSGVDWAVDKQLCKLMISS